MHPLIMALLHGNCRKIALTDLQKGKTKAQAWDIA